MLPLVHSRYRWITLEQQHPFLLFKVGQTTPRYSTWDRVRGLIWLRPGAVGPMTWRKSYVRPHHCDAALFGKVAKTRTTWDALNGKVSLRLITFCIWKLYDARVPKSRIKFSKKVINYFLIPLFSVIIYSLSDFFTLVLF